MAAIEQTESQPQPGDTLSTEYQPQSRMQWDWGWDEWGDSGLPPFDTPEEAEEWVQDKERRIEARTGPRDFGVEYRILKVTRVVERKVEI